MSSGLVPMALAEFVFLVQAPTSTAATTSTASRRLFKLQHRHEGCLRDLDRTAALHPTFALFLLFEEFALPGHVAAVTLGQHIFPHCRNRPAGDDLAAN